MERPKRHETIIYGGAFNPPTLAHLAILQACVGYAESRGNSDVWVVPSGTRRDKTIDVSRQTRLQYVQAMIADTDRRMVDISVDTSELDNDAPTETIDTVRALYDQHPDRDFRFVFGADSTQTMPSWRGGKELLERLPMLVVERPGCEVNAMARHAVKLEIALQGVSSTEVRRRRLNGDPFADLVSPAVHALL